MIHAIERCQHKLHLSNKSSSPCIIRMLLREHRDVCFAHVVSMITNTLMTTMMMLLLLLVA